MHRQLLEIIAGGLSPTAAARLIRIDPDTALLWATQAGIAVARRPKLITAAIRAAVIAELRLGRPKAAISEKHGISEVSVTRVLLSVPGLREQRERCIADAKTMHARAKMSAIIAKAPGLSVKQVRTKLGKDYMWLYRHDRAGCRQSPTSCHRAHVTPRRASTGLPETGHLRQRYGERLKS
ncbi:hypothetical protein FSC37_15985 [Piscinibacter aquaticus]|uniref:Transposon Tn7 transposition protein TnsD C-terminal domain-containing protein n=1 Tax=Piscinibacter aquaticus TaxID=392597 RepID=A0A5C6U6R7_9BURK|nr:hypothetical protein FSC37_15985 [Piscinibacter aquaticus]